MKLTLKANEKASEYHTNYRIYHIQGCIFFTYLALRKIGMLVFSSMKSTIIIFTLFISSVYAASDSALLWNKYFPKTDCEINPCGKNVSAKILEAFFERASDLASDKLYATEWSFLVDMNKNSKEKRGYLLNLKTGASESFHISHGKGSADGKGNAIKFSNTIDSKQTSLGLYVTAETYYGKHGYSLRMDGLEVTNDNARDRSIVIHAASYLTEDFIQKNGRAGRSWGCPAVAPEHNQRLIGLLKGGSLYFIFHDQLL